MWPAKPKRVAHPCPRPFPLNLWGPSRINKHFSNNGITFFASDFKEDEKEFPEAANRLAPLLIAKGLLPIANAKGKHIYDYI